MAYSVDRSFSIFHDAINLNGDHREIANKRRDRVVELLKKDFTIIDAFATGSIPKFTGLKGKSDVDVMVVLHFSKHIKDKTPREVLQAVRDSLSGYATYTRKNGQAVTLTYETWPNVDIVPVSYADNAKGEIEYYKVPNMNIGRWVKSLPRNHAKKIEAKATECGPNFRRIIKMIKHWNSIHGDYLQSYHIEVLAIKIFVGNIDDTPWNIVEFFEEGHSLLKNPLWYSVSYADNYLSDNDRKEVLKRFEAAKDKSTAAWHKTYKANNDHEGAIEIWRQIFGNKFPTYGS